MQNKISQGIENLIYWAELFSKEQSARPNKFRGGRLLFVYSSFVSQLSHSIKNASPSEKEVLKRVRAYTPTLSELLALFIRVDTDKIVSTRSLSKYPPDIRTELVILRDEDSLKAKKEKYQKNLGRILILLKELQ